MLKKISLITGVLCPVIALAQPVVFTFDSGIPAEDILGTERKATPKSSGGEHPYVEAAQDEELRSGVYRNIEDPARAGVFIKSARSAEDALGGELSQFTCFMKFKADELSASPVFFERLVKGTSAHPGFIRFRSQNHSEDNFERKGTFRLSVYGSGDESDGATSTQSWIQQKGVWYWVGVVFDHGKVTFYQDGSQVGDTVSLPVETIPGADEGKYQVRVGYGFLGSVDDIVFLPNKALDAKAMAEFAEKGIGLKTMQLKLK